MGKRHCQPDQGYPESVCTSIWEADREIQRPFCPSMILEIKNRGSHGGQF